MLMTSGRNGRWIGRYHIGASLSYTALATSIRYIKIRNILSNCVVRRNKLLTKTCEMFHLVKV
jgi:hypothetical protein